MRSSLRGVRACALLLPLVAAAACKPDAPPEPTPVPSAAPSAKPPPETVTSDSSRALAGGTTFTVPALWKVELDGARVVLTAPHVDFKSSIVEADVGTPEEAIAKAWRLLDPGFNRVLRLEGTMPARRGWDEIRSYEYKTTPEEGLAVNAAAMRHDGKWVGVAFVDNLSTLQGHAPSAGLFAGSITPKGYVKESFTGKKPAPLDADRIKQITGFLEHARETLEIPGLAVALVQDGKVVFSGGFGVRELGQPAKVDADTLFPISTNTRGLTTLLLAREIEDGKFTWDTPVTKIYPGFKLGDADRTAKVLMKHLPCGCTGLPREDLPFLFAHETLTPKGLVDGLAAFKPTAGFGETYLAATAGYVAGYVATPGAELGKAYEDAMKARVWGPLGMAATTSDVARARALGSNHAEPHVQAVDGKVKVASGVGGRAMMPVRPAMGAWSSAADLARYIQLELARGKLPDGKPLLSEESDLARRQATGPMGPYGVDKEWGVPLVEDLGALPGFENDMFLLPEAHVGGVLLANGDGGSVLRRPFVRKVLETLFDAKSEALEDIDSEAERRKAQIARNDLRYVVPPAADVLAKLATRYHDDLLGDLTVRRQGAACIFDLGAWKSAVASYVNDDGTTSMFTVDPGLDDWEFLVSEREGKRVLVLRNTPRPHVFKEVP